MASGLSPQTASPDSAPLSHAHPEPQITVLDAGGQYCHLIARKVRDLGVYADVQPSETPAEQLRNRKGIIISGGPASVYEPESPHIDPEILKQGQAVLGICYGLHLIAHELGGEVQRGDKGEYGLALLNILRDHELFHGTEADRQIWMSHRDLVSAAPPDFDVLASSNTCAVAAIAHRTRPVIGVQFHPEVAHTRQGNQILSNFLFRICHCERDWDPSRRVASIEQDIRSVAGDRNVFFFVSGGVDSTVAYTLCLRALGPDRVYGAYVDTGLMRERETEFVESVFARIGAEHFHVEHAQQRFLRALERVSDPERKRHIIGEQFVAVQESVLESGRFLDGQWILGQGTIYPDTIESGGSAKAEVIKTHHNRVGGIQKLIESGRILEPLSSFYKDEVRQIGRELGVPAEFLHRHPFPGPGLAIRCLCSEREECIVRTPEGWLVPVRSVGVQGDSRSYRAVLALDRKPDTENIHHATVLVNRIAEVNRIVSFCGGHGALSGLSVRPAFITPQRLDRLRRADAIVRSLCESSGFEEQVWQFPVILIPLGSQDRPDSIVLRPIQSVDGMTAEAVLMPEHLLTELVAQVLSVDGIAGVFYDLTHKPPGTIEWE